MAEQQPSEMTFKEWAEQSGFEPYELAANLHCSSAMLKRLVDGTPLISERLATRIRHVTAGQVRYDRRVRYTFSREAA